ncbi:Eco47II family restriction endonuclease [Eisenibacter elegans]|uniref:Eco47II family restriction endonuclease n=1 Tax=Eisenibacter elegans TaxID=997 RepID=UPI00041FAF2F
MSCVQTLHTSYLKAKANINKTKFYNNKIDVVKLIFDAKFNHMTEAQIIEAEILRQIDKSINNAIGKFHEQVLGGIQGFEQGQASGFDIKATDNTLFDDIKNKHNTMNSSAAESLFQKLSRYADTHKKAKCYWVQILAKSSFTELWSGDINGKEYSHSRVYKISGDQFYHLLTGSPTAFFDLYKVLPKVIEDFLNGTASRVYSATSTDIVANIEAAAKTSHRSVIDQITFDNFDYYAGFDRL